MRNSLHTNGHHHLLAGFMKRVCRKQGRILWIASMLLLAGPDAVKAQDAQVVDSLLNVLRVDTYDSSHVRTYLYLYGQYSRSDLDRAIAYAVKGNELAAKIGHLKGEAEATYRLGIAYAGQRNFTLAQKMLARALELSELMEDTIGMANAYSGMGKVNFERDENETAVANYFEALKLFELVGHRNSEARILNDLGTLYKKQRQFVKARAYYEDALAIVRELNFKPGISACLMNVGTMLLATHKHREALPYLEESLGIKKSIGDKLGECRARLNIGNVYRELARYDEANAHFINALELAKGVNPRETNIIQYNLALNELRRGDAKKALYYSKLSLEQSTVDRDLEMQMKSLDIMGDSYASLGEMEKAYECSKTINFLNDSLFDEKVVRISAELSAKYQNEKKEQEIIALNSENQLSALQLQKGKIERSYLLALTLLALLLGAVMWSRYRLKLKANEKLKQLDQTKSRFFANISHEFRTPLTLISGNLEDMKENISDNSPDGMRLSVMQRNADRLSQLIGQLLDLSKLESGKFKLCIAFANPGDFLRAVASSFSSWAEQKEIKLHVDISKRNESVYFDEEVLQKIIDNLLSNAIKFSPTQGTVSLSAEWNSEALTIHVGDEGPGIPPSKVSLIFERFYQVDDSASRKQEGSGIGLALVKELVALHHGRISVQSKPETGTVFTLVVPVNKERYASSEIRGSEAKSVQHSPAIGNGRTPLHADPPEPEGARPLILVVEDNADLASYIGNHLPGYDVVFAANGLEGLDKAIGQVPDLIVSDVMMPEMDGIALCHNIKTEEKTSHIPFILLTAKADMGSRLEGLETGADDYMTKPFDARELQTRVRNLIQQREILRGRFSRTVILKPKDIAITSPDEAFLEKVMAIIEGHLDDSEFTVDDFQKEIGMSRMQLHRKLKALTGQSAGEFVRTQRLIRASEILTKTDNNISEVCYQTGFTSLSYFAKCFKKQFGTTPKDYAAMHAQRGTHSR